MDVGSCMYVRVGVDKMCRYKLTEGYSAISHGYDF